MKYIIAYIQIDIDASPGMWAPVVVEHVSENVFRVTNRGPIDNNQIGNWKEVVDNNIYDPEFEEWEFPPGTLVRCEWFTSERGVILKAVEKIVY